MHKKGKKKRFTLVYSRKTHDDGKPIVTYVFGKHPFDILAMRCTREVEQAKQRVEITPDKRYRYTPSPEYEKFFKKFLKVKKRIETNPPSILYEQKKKRDENNQSFRGNASS